MTHEAREDYERFILSDRPKYIPIKPEKLAKLSPEDRQEYENSLKITKTPRRYALRSRFTTILVLNFVKCFEEINVF
jgi:hypothetical protein